ncbi:hypothetical protein QP027_02355 [Corynebacterium breve]|uniref:TlpA family protein disulfide reductase n=1 Tax=Corynebacterium breve TaxID=3049799 RepID=A0ABY8VFL3_9CORY|nr:hypothetical protein [Corynebacterium breve]WIM68264.1 hypothetical protein QP027_02355 [Corynebacterium breve]
MEADRRRVLLFIAAGLLVATLIGVTVWYAGSPTENRDQQTSGAASVATSTAHTEKAYGV